MNAMYDFFYSLAEYANNNWGKGKFTPREVANTAYIYCQNVYYGADEFATVIENLEEDVRNGNKDAQKFIDEIYEWCEA